MQNIRNFKLVLPFVEDAKKLGDAVNTIQFLMSGDGQDWYECQRLFSDDTIKIMYDENGVIRSVVDKPVRERGNTYAVSMFFPLNMSVAEIAVGDYPEGVSLDGTWKFDGERVYQDKDTFDANVLAANTSKRDALIAAAFLQVGVIQCSTAVGNPRDGDSGKLRELQQYVDQLRDVGPSNHTWPPVPEFINSLTPVNIRCLSKPGRYL